MNSGKGQLYPDALVECHLLCDLPGVVKDRNTEIPLLWIDTAGCDCMEETESSFADEYNAETIMLGSESKRNQNEVELCFRHVEELLKAKVDPKQIGVISPYSAQIRKLRKRLVELSGRLKENSVFVITIGIDIAIEDIEVSTVDGFQGREKEAIILSLVRSNDIRELGFLTDYRRINVAITRARRHICIVGNSDMMENDAFLSQLVSYCFENGQVRYATEYDASLQGEVSRRKPLREEKLKSSYPANVERKKNQRQQMTRISHSEVGQEKGKKQDEGTSGNKIEEQLKEFIRSEATDIKIFSQLSSYERRIVHQLAEKYCLGHESLDTDDGRVVKLWKQSIVAQEPTLSSQKSSSCRVDQKVYIVYRRECVCVLSEYGK